MSELNPRTRALLELGRNGDDPTDRDAAKNRRALVARLGAATVLGAAGLASSTPASAATTGMTAAKLSGIIAGFVIVGAVVTGVVLMKPAAPPSPAVVVTSAVPALVEQPAVPAPVGLSGSTDDAVGEKPKGADEEVAPSSRADHAKRGGPVTENSSRAAGRQRPSSALGDEVDLIRAAQEQLHQGNAGAALQTLAEHARRFPNGALSEERQVSKILALCQLGNVGAARAEADRFVIEAPGSPLIDRVRGACRAAPSPSR